MQEGTGTGTGTGHRLRHSSYKMLYNKWESTIHIEIT